MIWSGTVIKLQNMSQHICVTGKSLNRCWVFFQLQWISRLYSNPFTTYLTLPSYKQVLSRWDWHIAHIEFCQKFWGSGMLSEKMPNIFTDLTGSKLSQFFMGKISTGILHTKHEHMTYWCCLSLEKFRFITRCVFVSSFRNIAEPYNWAIQKGQKSFIFAQKFSIANVIYFSP